MLGAFEVEAGEFLESPYPVPDGVGVHGQPRGDFAYLLIVFEVDPGGLLDVVICPARTVERFQMPFAQPGT
nr:hypothetical protein [Catellatospora sichuanensis]